MAESTALDLPRAAAAIDSLERHFGGREKLLDALILAPIDDDDPLAYVIGLIADPRVDARSLSDICRAGKVSVGEVMEAYKRGAYAQMQVEVIAAVAANTPVIVRDVLRQAQPHEEVCVRCHGETVIRPEGQPDAAPTPCPLCRGTGVSLQPGTIDHAKLALDLAGLTSKRTPGVVIDQRTQMADTSPGGLVKMLGAIDALLYPRTAPRTIDAAVIDADPVDAPTDPV